MWWVLFFKEENVYSLIRSRTEPANFVIDNGIKYHGSFIGKAGLIF
jgi:hypothetical protein